ncbi:hypothetical protein PhaeoP23_03983 (plasmid) [Phaeobacter piscinae]|uniref:Lipoprotein n=1 Tax=Phaeobacter piscinae TaxID=1580596 RepID=A0ABM6PJX1_9RHOB|nr:MULTISPECIES: hypothetical protein [Phaeobacter]ATG38136.1 hypothetical protein PhaeoP36_04061 [Phaeobacter piscinae]AUQ88657.1 hypothetical protein PhaeoP42_04062 [Phaeobacter piscinae]AUQ92656.1 hypothetical protein PhaeoP24_04098 [Phaeobacter inhibens]AUR26462.1 hypothetical protein PhaeoP23_03983 [Phaeobacter piscinae]
MQLKMFLLAGCAALALAGCKEDLSSITDDQLAMLLGTGGNGDRPARITKKTLECTEVLGGINEATYKDMPEDMLGGLKTECRKYFKGRLDDPERNLAGLVLEDFERADLAERIAAVASAQAAALAEQRKAQRAAKIEALAHELAETAAEGKALKVELQQRHEVLVPACEKLAELRGDLKSRNRGHRLFSKGLPFVCSGQPLSKDFQQLERFEKRLARFKLPKVGGTDWSVVPGLPRVNIEQIDAQIQTVEAVTAEYLAALAEY